MRYDRVSFGGLMLGVCLFAAAGFAEESHLNGKWHLDSPEESSVKREKGPSGSVSSQSGKCTGRIRRC